ncbi:MAG TPA: hypothetical protein VN688_00265 [Gemmataceae bacterium]|nr:hypothetical protein [Gemmataceae bacterium]
MKVKVNIRNYLEGNAGCGINVEAHVDTDDLWEALDLPDEDEFDFDLDETLEERRQVAVIWTNDHVQEIRPDLSEDQSWEVLKTCRARWGSCQGIDWQAIEMTADELFGPKPARCWYGRIDVTIDDTDGYGQGEVITQLRNMAELLAKDMPGIQAHTDEGSVRLVEEAQP